MKKLPSFVFLAVLALVVSPPDSASSSQEQARTVRARVQAHPGGPVEDVEMEGTPLEALPSLQTTWRFWRQQQPDTRVMVVEGRDGRPYLYHDFVPGEARGRPAEHDTSTVGLGLAASDESWFFPLSELERTTTPLSFAIDGQQVTIHYNADGMTAWAEDAAGNVLVTVIAYENGWKSFFPDTRRFSAGR